MFASYYGLTRKEALKLKHWEFENYRKYYRQQKARDTLTNYQCIGLAFGGSAEDSKEYIADLKDRAGYNKPQSVSTENSGKMNTVFIDVMGLMNSSEYLEFKNTNNGKLTR